MQETVFVNALSDRTSTQVCTRDLADILAWDFDLPTFFLYANRDSEYMQFWQHVTARNWPALNAHINEYILSDEPLFLNPERQ